MNRHVVIAALLLSGTGARAQLASKIAHYDVTKTATSKAVHDGAGTMNFDGSTNLLFLHRGVLHPHSGIGEHFHNHCAEMFGTILIPEISARAAAASHFS